MLADENDKWTSILANSKDMPEKWFHIINENTIKLKDIVGRGIYNNTFLSSNRFKYELPRNQSYVKTLLMNVSVGIEERPTIFLYAVAHGQDHFLGKWKVIETQCTGHPAVILGRLTTQDDNSNTSKKQCTRSFSEKRHAEILRNIFHAFHVEFEPECASGLKVAYVQDGTVNKWCSDFYTIDFVVSDISTGRMFWFESKPIREKLDAVALQKCRRLRDMGMRRVIAIVDHGPNLKFYDFATSNDTEQWFHDHCTLAKALNII